MAFQPAPAPLLTRSAVPVPVLRVSARPSEPQAVLPAAAKYAFLAALFAGPSVQAGYAVESKLGIYGPFRKFVASDTFQKGGGNKIRRMADVPKVKVRSARLPADAVAVANTFKKQYTSKELEQVYGALLQCYGKENRALAAIASNPQILNPSYSFAPTIVESKRVLRTVMSEEEAQEVMRLNPAVLQCGPSLDVLGASEIKSIARARSIGNIIFPEQTRTPIISAGIASIALLVFAQQPNADPAVLETVGGLKPLLGAGLVSIFAFVLYGVSTTGRKLDQVQKQYNQ